MFMLPACLAAACLSIANQWYEQMGEVEEEEEEEEERSTQDKLQAKVMLKS